MTRPCPLPPRASLRDLLTDLLGRPVSVTTTEPQVLVPDRPALAATYRRDDGTVGAAYVCSREFAIGSGAAIGMLSVAQAAEQVTPDGQLAGDLRDFFHEVVNVMGKLLNSPSTPHVTLRDLSVVPGMVPPDLAACVLQPVARADYAVTVDGCGSGQITLIAG